MEVCSFNRCETVEFDLLNNVTNYNVIQFFIIIIIIIIMRNEQTKKN